MTSYHAIFRPNQTWEDAYGNIVHHYDLERYYLNYLPHTEVYEEIKALGYELRPWREVSEEELTLQELAESACFFCEGPDWLSWELIPPGQTTEAILKQHASWLEEKEDEPATSAGQE